MCNATCTGCPSSENIPDVRRPRREFIKRYDGKAGENPKEQKENTVLISLLSKIILNEIYDFFITFVSHISYTYRQKFTELIKFG